MNISLAKLRKNFPFLTVVRYLNEDYIGIVQNSDSTFVTMYVYNAIKDQDLKKKFLILGENWWWESNRTIPIDMFLNTQWKMFKPYMKTFSRKDLEHLEGPMLSLQDIISKRIKRRTIVLVRNVD